MTQKDTNRYDDFDSLVARHRKLIRGLCRWKAGGQAWLMSELIQEVTTQLWHYRHKLRPDATPGEEREWVRFHCRSVFAHSIRKREREVEVVPPTKEIIPSLSTAWPPISPYRNTMCWNSFSTTIPTAR